MQQFISFLKAHKKLIFFGFILTFFSSYGQTFLISLYVPEISLTFNLTNTELSSLYAIATIASAFCLPWVGQYIDYWPLNRFTIVVLIGFSIALFTLSMAPHVAFVLIGLWGMRLFGQGLMSHTSISTMARAYEANRGKAISLATLGHPAGEATLPLLIAFLIGGLGWRMPLRISALSLIVLVLPLALYLIKDARMEVLKPNQTGDKTDEKGAGRNPLKILTTKHFWIIGPTVFLLGFINTAVFFFQVRLGESRGWEPEWVAASLSAYAAATATALMVSGPLIDRISARLAFPFFMIPYAIGLVLLASFDMPLIYPVSLCLMGASNGFGKTIKNAVLAELYGTSIIGTVRSLFTTVMVFSTALGPVSFGFFLDREVGFPALLITTAIVMVLSMIWSLQILKR